MTVTTKIKLFKMEESKHFSTVSSFRGTEIQMKSINLMKYEGWIFFASKLCMRQKHLEEDRHSFPKVR